MSVPGCLGLYASKSDADFCIEAANPVLVYSSEDASLTGICEGDCDDDHDCPSGLMCFKRKGFERVPNCDGTGVKGKVSLGCCEVRLC